MDPETGFRRYAAGQLADAAVIRRLRELEVPAMSAVAVTGVVREGAYDAFLVAAYARLEQACLDAGVSITGPSSALYDAGFLDDAEQEVTAYFPVDAGIAAAGTTLLHLPPVTAAVVTHAGDHETLPDTYGLLGAWVAHHGTPTGQPLREAYVANVSDGVPPSAYQTDIVWPLTPRKDSP